jgi:hypothetical protein
MVVSWVMPWGQLAWLRAYDDALARRAFDSSSSYVVGGGVPGYAVTPVKNFTSFDTYAQTNAAWSGWVCYDLENWPASPAIDKADPAAAYSHFASLAKARGHWLIAAPSRDLVYALPPAARIQTGEDINAAYLRCRIPAAGAGAPVLLVQAQGVQKDLPTFTGLVEGAAAQQVPGANQALWVGLTTSFATVAQMQAAYSAVAGQVAGFWLTIATSTPGSADPAQVKVAADFLKAVLP